jgi:hypothetical protein
MFGSQYLAYVSGFYHVIKEMLFKYAIRQAQKKRVAA